MPTTPGARIKALRKERGFTQVTFAAAVAVTQPAVSQWEQDNYLPAGPLRLVVAESLGTSVDYLFGEQVAS